MARSRALNALLPLLKCPTAILEMNTCHYITPLITITILTATHTHKSSLLNQVKKWQKKKSLTTETTRIIPVNATMGQSVKPRFLTPSRVNGHGQSIDTIITPLITFFSVGHDSAEFTWSHHYSLTTLWILTFDSSSIGKTFTSGKLVSR